MKTHTYVRKAKLFAPLCLLVVLLISGLAACGGAANALQNTTAPEPGATTVVTTYLQLFNAGMRSGDFSTMDSVFAPDATLTQSNPKGVTTVVHGLAAITRFYQDAGSPPLRVAGRCVHVFVVEDGKITSYDWATYYPGLQ